MRLAPVMSPERQEIFKALRVRVSTSERNRCKAELNQEGLPPSKFSTDRAGIDSKPIRNLISSRRLAVIFDCKGANCRKQVRTADHLDSWRDGFADAGTVQGRAPRTEAVPQCCVMNLSKLVKSLDRKPFTIEARRYADDFGEQRIVRILLKRLQFEAHDTRPNERR